MRVPPGFSLTTLDEAGSTNDEAARMAQDGAPHGTVVRARSQTAGRGRRGRIWVSPPGNLYCSAILRPDAPPAEAARLGFVAAVALARAIGPKARCKWPNDVLLDNRKVAGVLLECRGGGIGLPVDWVVIGTGVNVAHFPEGTEFPATSLMAQGIKTSAEAVLSSYLGHLSEIYDLWRERGFAPVRAEWLSRAAGVGEAIKVRLSDRTLTGRFAGLDEGGILILESEGRRQHISSADVFFT